jgi:hypothetical protein
MAAVPVLQADADRAAAFAADVREIMVNGSAVGATAVTDILFAPVPPTFPTGYDLYDAAPEVQRNYVEAVALALIRLNQNGAAKFPVQLPLYVKTALPSAAANTGNMIFVTNEVGGATPAFSDGVHWLRTSDRAIVS